MDWAAIQSEWAYFVGAFVTLLFIIDPFALVPVYLTLTERFSTPDLAVIRRKAILIAFAMLVLFSLAGMRVFALFGITLPAFQIAGGLLLLTIGISQVNANRRKVNSDEEGESHDKDDISVFPLATPLLAGPGAISTVILYATEAGSHLRIVELLAAITGCMAVSYAVLLASPGLLRFLGKTGLNLLSRIMGLVLTAVAVQFILNGVTEAYRALGR